jgi:predicted TIM-barrel fold metal-dependent hydrolase
MPVTSEAIDCDVHISVPGTSVLLQYLEPYWVEQVKTRGIDDLELTSSMLNSPLACRPDWRPASGKPAGDYDTLLRDYLSVFDPSFAICNCIWGAQAVHAEDLAAALCRALNRWIADHWLDRDPRLRASIILPSQSPRRAAEEIEYWAKDARFVQALLLVGGEMPLGQRSLWPIYRAAQEHGIPIGIHAGSAYRHATTSIGWPSSYAEEYVAYAGSAQAQLMSFICEGVFAEFRDLKLVFLECGVGWVPSFLWRAEKGWRAIRFEVPWVHNSPIDIVRERVRLTLQPFDAPEHHGDLKRFLEQMGSDDMLLFSTDYPHWHFEGTDALPKALPAALVQKVLKINPLQTYPRLGGAR